MHRSRKVWLFAGSDRGGDRAAAIYTSIVTAKMNDIDPQAYLADVLARIRQTRGASVAHLLTRPSHLPKISTPLPQPAGRSAKINEGTFKKFQAKNEDATGPISQDPGRRVLCMNADMIKQPAKARHHSLASIKRRSPSWNSV